MNIRYFTSESVTEGHPDKICDRIADSVLDFILSEDKKARVACEVCCGTGFVMLMGEITTESYADMQKIARTAVLDVGFDRAKYGFDGNTCAVLSSINEQSPDIAQGVDLGDALGAGDQGMMFGYACNETPVLMPLPIMLAHGLTRQLAFARKNGLLPYLRPDGKAQVTVEYHDGVPARLDSVVVSTQHAEEISLQQIRADVIRCIIREVIDERLIDENTKFFINPTGRFVVGGPGGDSGVTGRKIIVDTYGGYARHGGGAFSGKDPTKVDRSGAYAARWAAKNIVAAGLADKCELQLSYAIGIEQPLSLLVDTFGTGKYPEEAIAKAVRKTFDFSPSGIIKELDLINTNYTPLSSYGHFGREELGVKWELTNKVSELLSNL